MDIKGFVKFFLYLDLKIRLGDKRFIVPIIKGNGFQNLKLKGDWFLLLLEKVSLPGNSIFIDVGVNVGQTILKFRSHFQNPYIGFEPNPNCVLYTKKLIRANKFRDISIYPVGLSDKNDIAVFHSGHKPDNCCTDSTIVKELRPGYYTEQDKSFVPVYCFDSLKIIKEGDSVSMVKIDAEGAELEIIIGMKEMIERFHPLIVCEVLDYDSEETAGILQQRADSLFELIRGLDYKVYRIGRSGERLIFNEITRIDLTKWTASSEGSNDYLFVHPSGQTCPVLL